jgi:glycosyltransferase involved in cell wall biosynthesis
MPRFTWPRRRPAGPDPLAGPLPDPFLSVVVPVHNVAGYLASSLDSILRQPLREIQVIVVDDASTDGSTEIAEAYAAKHDRIQLVKLPEKSGVSIARNVAMPLCTAPYLTFVDSDDDLPPDAWGTMLRTLLRTGSDFVVGSAERVSTERRYVTPLMKRNHEVERLGITIEDAPLMLADVFVWNKIFTREFWTRAGIHFPERTRYQDQPALTQAFLAARSFDVITEIVYEWRFREDLTSATQRRVEITNMRERRGTKLLTVDMVRDHGSAEIMDVLLREILPIDMWEHFRAAVVAGDEYREVLRDMQRQIWTPATVPFERTTVPASQRVMGVLVDQARWDDLATLIAHIDGLDGQLPRAVVGGREEVVLPFRDDPAMPAEAYAVTPVR